MTRQYSIGVDIGGTNVRVGLVKDGRVLAFFKVPAPRTRGGRFDLRGAVRLAAASIKRLAAGHPEIKTVGVSAPGAYLKDGRIYRGTAPNIPALERVKLFQLFARALGDPWRVGPRHVNNDGVLQAWMLAEAYVKSSPIRNGKIVAMVPGTGFGAGVVAVRNGVAKPLAGPQQLFDVVIRKDGKGRPLTAEDLLTGRGLERIGGAVLGRPIDGESLSRLALSRRETSARAREIFRQVGRDLAQMVRILRAGRYQKRVVPFRAATRGASVFLVGGSWFLKGAARRYALTAARRLLRQENVTLLSAQRFTGQSFRPERIGVLGAALLARQNSPKKAGARQGSA